MDISANFEFPKQYYEIQVTYFSKVYLKDFILELESLSPTTINDLSNFSYIIELDDVTELAIFFLNIYSVNELKLLFDKSEFIKCQEIKEITKELLTGKYNNQDFWTILEDNENDNFKKDEVEFFFNFIKRNSTIDDVLDKINNRGLSNLLKPEIQILNYTFN